ncbi:hypothetical protein Hanom_Chr04g00326711 [Helianthus anomalus]
MVDNPCLPWVWPAGDFCRLHLSLVSLTFPALSLSPLVSPFLAPVSDTPPCTTTGWWWPSPFWFVGAD